MACYVLRVGKLLCEGPESKHFRFYGPYGSVKYVNEGHGFVTIKLCLWILNWHFASLNGWEKKIKRKTIFYNPYKLCEVPIQYP